MASSSNSTTTNVIQTGGSLGTGSSVATFKDGDYGAQGLGTRENLRRFLSALNPIISQVKLLGDSGVSLSNLDCDFLSYNLPSYQSEWINVAVTATVTGGTGITCFDGTAGKIAVRKDPWGRVDVYVFVTTSGAGSLATLPQEMWPARPTQFALAGTTTVFTIDSTTGVLSVSAAIPSITACQFLSYPCANLSPGTIPAFPVYLKIATGRTPVACIFAGAKPQVSQDIYKSSTGILGAALGCAWTYTSAGSKAADGSTINQIRIDSVPGLTSNVPYVLNFLVFYGQTGSSSGG